jgi:hypothetical protein
MGFKAIKVTEIIEQNVYVRSTKSSPCPPSPSREGSRGPSSYYTMGDPGDSPMNPWQPETSLPPVLASGSNDPAPIRRGVARRAVGATAHVV